MALVDPHKTHRIDIPDDEPGAWIEFRVLMAGDLEFMESPGPGVVQVTKRLLAEVITAWSYGEWPASPEERVALLKTVSLPTHIWMLNDPDGLGNRLLILSGIKDEDAKKNFDSNSLPEAEAALQPILST